MAPSVMEAEKVLGPAMGKLKKQECWCNQAKGLRSGGWGGGMVHWCKSQRSERFSDMERKMFEGRDTKKVGK